MKKIWLFGVFLLLSVFLAVNVLADRIILMMPPILAAQNNTSPPPSSGTVISAGGRKWMDRNLGASRVATSSADSLAYTVICISGAVWLTGMRAVQVGPLRL